MAKEKFNYKSVRHWIGLILVAGFITFFFNIDKLLTFYVIPVDQYEDGSPEHNHLWVKETKSVLDNATAFWSRQLKKEGISYQPPKVSFFFGKRPNACGSIQESDTPLYCLEEGRIDVDTAYFQVLSRRLNHYRYMAVAYTLAHQVGHHVQKQMGWLDEAVISDLGSGDEPKEKYLERLELQADCLAGMWMQQSQSEFGTIRKAAISTMLKKLQEQSVWDGNQIYGTPEDEQPNGFQADPESLELPDYLLSGFGGHHGISERPYYLSDSFYNVASPRREFWFKRGFEAGTLQICKHVDQDLPAGKSGEKADG